MVKSVAIIGTGKMGLWFCNYFSKKNNFNVSLFDKRKINLDLKKYQYRVTICNSLNTCVRKADIVIVCVPISITSSIINKCVPIMKKGACIVEISSIKTDVFDTLLKIPRDLVPLSIHPMFGPGAKRLRDTKILIIPVRNKETEQKIVNSLFNETKTIVVKGPKYHDSFMAVILGIVYYVNLLLAVTLSKENITLLRKFSGTTFYLQALLFESILTDNSSLITSLLVDNKELLKYLKKFNQESAKLFTIINKNKFKLEKRISRIKKDYTNKANIAASYEKLYSIRSEINDR
ncbi:MAG TPA: prephenate dehydrogenase/arogenate dehydrogenase family protein [Nitrososphaeraceae archaeon]|nr:prephenate dehydrogenase/arogenate dehydrogenase family protein [Nitrososphaeraceae archaeon]